MYHYDYYLCFLGQYFLSGPMAVHCTIVFRDLPSLRARRCCPLIMYANVHDFLSLVISRITKSDNSAVKACVALLAAITPP